MRKALIMAIMIKLTIVQTEFVISTGTTINPKPPKESFQTILVNEDYIESIEYAAHHSYLKLKSGSTLIVKERIDVDSNGKIHIINPNEGLVNLK